MPPAPTDGTRKSIPRKVQGPKSTTCFLCETDGGELREAMTINVNSRINECARLLSDQNLLAKMSAGDVIAQEMKYHPTCLVLLYNRERDYLKAPNEDEQAKKHLKEAYLIAFSELVTYIYEKKAGNDSTDQNMFKLADLAKLHKQRLE